MLTTLITIGVDFIVIVNAVILTHIHALSQTGSPSFVLAQMLTEIALPLLFAATDGLMCLLDYFKPSGWNDQLECVEQTCRGVRPSAGHGPRWFGT